MYGCHDDRPCRHGPTPVVAYICTSDEAARERLTRKAEEYTRFRGWPHVATVIEEDPHASLDHRRGWRKVLDHTSGEAEVVAIPSRAHTGLDEHEFEDLRNTLRRSDVLLVMFS
jgi:hypothetical protein